MENEFFAHEKMKHLTEILREYKNAAIAFSGGVDSTFLLKAAADVLGNNIVAVTAQSAIHPERETEYAVSVAKKMGVRHILIETDELAMPEFTRNPKNRCYICKRGLFWKLSVTAAELGIQTILEGSNTDDLTDFRPGMRALRELGIKSPFLEAGLDKAEIRLLSKKMGLSSWDKPSYACLATRFPYGDKITFEKLLKVDRCEQYLLGLGFKRVRVRHHGDLARIEVGKKETARFLENGLLELVVNECKEAGFTYCTLDLDGYRTGSMNEAAAREGSDE